VKIPPSNLKPDYVEQAQTFATELADSLGGNRQPQDNGGKET
jgi:hypothetical protein